MYHLVNLKVLKSRLQTDSVLVDLKQGYIHLGTLDIWQTQEAAKGRLVYGTLR